MEYIDQTKDKPTRVDKHTSVILTNHLLKEKNEGADHSAPNELAKQRQSPMIVLFPCGIVTQWFHNHTNQNNLPRLSSQGDMQKQNPAGGSWELYSKSFHSLINDTDRCE